MRMSIALLVLLMGLCSGSGMAAPQRIVNQAGALPTVTTSSAITPDAEVLVLREQNRMMKDFQSSVLDTVYWALSGVFTVTVLMAGFGWWSNFRVYENDKKRLHDELAGKIAELESRLELRAETGKTELERIVDSKTENFSNRISIDIHDLRNQISPLITQAVALKDELRAEGQRLKSQIDQVDKRVWNVRSDLRHVEEHVWDIKKVPENILITQSQALAAAVKTENADRVKVILHRIKATLEDKFASVALEDDTREIMESELSNASKLGGVQVAEVLAVLSSVAAAANETLPSP